MVGPPQMGRGSGSALVLICVVVGRGELRELIDEELLHCPADGLQPDGVLLLARELRQITEDQHFRLRVALWADIHTNASVYITPQTYLQEGFLKLEGGWGSITAGRQLALFNRGAIEIDFNYGHNYGVGWPCNFNFIGPACGQIGYGALFPFFSAFIGMLGVFVTGSDTASNSLFGPLQATTARISGIDPLLAALSTRAQAKTPDETAELELLLSATLLAAVGDSGDLAPEALLAAARQGDARRFIGDHRRIVHFESGGKRRPWARFRCLLRSPPPPTTAELIQNACFCATVATATSGYPSSSPCGPPFHADRIHDRDEVGRQ